MHAGLPSKKVSNLIDPVQRVWKEQVLDRYLFEFEAAVIKRIPLCQSIQDDILIWPWNPNGVYSIKSEYQLLQRASQAQQPSHSMVENLNPLWDKIWVLNVPAKVKNLAWHACQNSLPTKTNRVKRKVIAESVCDNCKQQQEDTAHALYHCSNLDSLWTSIPQWNHSTLKQSMSFIEMLGFVFARNRNPELFISVIWTVWNHRNNLRLGKLMVPLSQLLQLA